MLIPAKQLLTLTKVLCCFLNIVGGCSSTPDKLLKSSFTAIQFATVNKVWNTLGDFC